MAEKILIIHTAFIGDIVLTTPLIRAVKKYLKPVQLDFLTIPSSKNLLEKNPYIDNLIIYDKRGSDSGLSGFLATAKKLRRERYDICFCPHRSLRSALLSLMSKAKRRIGFSTSVLPLVFTDVVPYRPELHETRRNLSLLNSLGITSEEDRPEIFTDDNDEQLLKTRDLNFTMIPVIAMAPGSVWPTKRWPLEYYMQLARLFSGMGIKIVLVGGPTDFEACMTIAGQVKDCINTAGKLTLRQTKLLLEKCMALVTNDSAPLHLGRAADIPVFAVFGPTVPQFGFAPFGNAGYTLEIEGLACRPCGIHGGRKCPAGTFDCMRLMNPQKVFDYMLTRLSLKPEL